MVELYEEIKYSLERWEGSGVLQKEKPRVEHLGNGVYVHRNKNGRDIDVRENKSVTIIREESRGVM